MPPARIRANNRTKHIANSVNAMYSTRMFSDTALNVGMSMSPIASCLLRTSGVANENPHRMVNSAKTPTTDALTFIGFSMDHIASTPIPANTHRHRLIGCRNLAGMRMALA